MELKLNPFYTQAEEWEHIESLWICTKSGKRYRFVKERRGHWKNADCIKAMTDKELAEWLTMIERRAIEKAMSKPNYYTDEELKADWLDWLKQEAVE